MNRFFEFYTDRRKAIFEQCMFWGWNVIFLAIMLLGFAPLQLSSLIENVRKGITPPIYLVFTLILIAIPVTAVLIGALPLRKQPARLFALGYVVEWPVLLILLFNFYLSRAGNPAITVLLVWLGLAEATFLWHLLDSKIDGRRPAWIYLRLAGLTLLFSGTMYAAIWLLFYVPPIAVLIWEGLRGLINALGDVFREFRFARWYDLPLSILGMMLGFFSGFLILMMPVIAPVLAGRAWLHSLRCARSSTSRGNTVKTALTALLPLATVLVWLVVSMIQPQQAAFKLLEKPPSTLQQAELLYQQKEQIRTGLLNAYLASFRYMSSVNEVRHISDIYRYTLSVPPVTAWHIEQAYEVVIRPLLYAPVHPVTDPTSDIQAFNTEPQEAAILYQHMFDQTIVKGELQTITEAVRANPNGQQAELAWQAVDDREVHLKQQEVTLSEHGDWADVQIHEVYENQTSQRQEVVYYFNLPETAVVTGLWLGKVPDRSKAYVYQVAPRGSAQAEYRSEIRYNRDPALVEQIGPRQYRLRAFPVEPGNWSGLSNEFTPGPELHLWITYRTLALDDKWPLPQLSEKRNVFWDPGSTRLVNGKPFSDQNSWLPQALPASLAVVRTTHRVDFPGGMVVIARPADNIVAPKLPDSLRLAVVVDRSYSMSERASDVQRALDSIHQVVKTGPEPDLYLTASKYRGEGASRVGLASLDPRQVFYFGGQNAAELLLQFEQLQAGKQYDAIIVLTDGNGYELGEGNSTIKVPDAPIWVVHLGGGLPLGYDDPTLQAIQASGGGIAATVDEALRRYAVSREMPGLLDIVDGYVWQTISANGKSTRSDLQSAELDLAPDHTGFQALAARRVILSEMAQNHGTLDQLPILDQLNRLAVEQSIVTPYSSMIVLVNEAQEANLEKLSGMADRYQREVESIGGTTQTNPFAVTGVPEPEEWLLILLSAGVLAYAGWRKIKPHSTLFKRFTYR
jgi:putative PEP-CTERM system integral membrane protein